MTEGRSRLRHLELRMLVAGSRTQLITSFASVAINSIILANSAAAGALLAFIASLPKAERTGPLLELSVYCLKVFTLGSFLGILCAVTAYAAQSCYAVSELAGDATQKQARFARAAMTLHAIALLLGFLGAAFFPLGAFHGLNALSHWAR